MLRWRCAGSPWICQSRLDLGPASTYREQHRFRRRFDALCYVEFPTATLFGRGRETFICSKEQTPGELLDGERRHDCWIHTLFFPAVEVLSVEMPIHPVGERLASRKRPDYNIHSGGLQRMTLLGEKARNVVWYNRMTVPSPDFHYYHA